MQALYAVISTVGGVCQSVRYAFTFLLRNCETDEAQCAQESTSCKIRVGRIWVPQRLLQQAATIATFVDMNDSLAARVMTTGAINGNMEMLKLRLKHCVKHNAALGPFVAESKIGKIIAPYDFHHYFFGESMKEQWMNKKYELDKARLHAMQEKVGADLPTIEENAEESDCNDAMNQSNICDTKDSELHIRRQLASALAVRQKNGPVRKKIRTKITDT